MSKKKKRETSNPVGLSSSTTPLVFPLELSEYDYATLKLSIEKQLRTSFEGEYAEKLNKAVKSFDEEMKSAIEKKFDEWNAEQEKMKLEAEDIQKLLNQEYAEFTLKVKTVLGGKEKTFILRELPQSLEKKFVDILSKKLRPHLKEIASLTTKIAEGKLEAKFDTIMSMIGPSFDIMAEATALVLNPYGSDEEITVEWVQSNIASNRQWVILTAQEKLNNLRNFISLASLLSLGKVA